MPNSQKLDRRQYMRRILTLLTLILNLNLLAVQPAFAAPQNDVTNDHATINFPTTVTFSASIEADANITSVVLEYGTEQLTCGEVVAKAFPQFTPAKSVDVEWTWDMRQSGSLPPGTTIWWHWRYTDETGNETVSDQQTVIWLDAEHNWKTISKDKLNLHWYSGDQAFAQDLLNSAQIGLDRNKKSAGLTPSGPINLYIYSSIDDLRESVLYEPSWTGGLTYGDHNIILIGIVESDPVWNQNVIIHEVTHVLVGNLTFSCLGGLPTWLEEGLAVYSEGELDASSQQQLDDAIQNDTLLSVRSLSAGFSEVSDKALLSYSQSYSIVKFLIETYGQEKMTELLTALRDGAAIDDALMDVYGFDVEGLEDAWREAIGAQARSTSAQATAQPTPTYVPTIVPVSGAPLANQSTTPVPTSSFSDPAEESSIAQKGPPIILTLALLGFCCVFLILIGVIVLGIFLRAKNPNGGNNV
jgi:hypothetical protein